MFDDFMTTEMLTTFVGLVAATSLIVQFTKPIIKKWISGGYIRLYVFIIALILTFIFGEGDFSPQNIALRVINAIIVTTSAMGSYETLSSMVTNKK